MASITHPFDPDTLYELNKDGNIQLTNGNSVGIFTTKGVWLSGDIKHADPQLCVWVGNNPGAADEQSTQGHLTINAKRS